MQKGGKDNPQDSRILRHTERKKELTYSAGDSELIEKIDDHITKHIGKITNVYHEFVSVDVHLDIFHVPPNRERNYHTMITGGMSEKPMNTPKEIERMRFAELVITLPPNWPLSDGPLTEDPSNWPIKWMEILGRLPHAFNTFLGWGHTIPNGDPPEPFAPDTKLCCMLLLSNLLEPEEFYSLKLGKDRTIYFYDIFPIYKEEMEFILKYDTDKILDRFSMKNIGNIIDINRKNVCKRGLRFR
jgi:hypothetical protein